MGENISLLRGDGVWVPIASIYEKIFLRDLVHNVVQTIKKNFKVDWTEPHREDVKAAVSAAVKRVLRRCEGREEDFEPFLDRIINQAETIFANWPVAA